MKFKESVITLAIVYGGFQAYEHFTKSGNSTESRSSFSNAYSVNQHQRFNCDGRQYCSQMTSRQEAEFFVRNCPNTKMDGDNDGIPCERDSRW